MVKRKFGGRLRSKGDTTQVNEASGGKRATSNAIGFVMVITFVVP
jgi:hypothetical protein